MPARQAKNNHPPRVRALLIGAITALGALALWLLGSRLQSNYRVEQLLQSIQAAAQRNELEPELVLAVIWKESRFNPQCVGSKGEIGLMQITDGAVQDWARLNHQPPPSREELFRSEKNLMLGCWYLAHCRRHWEGYASQEILQLAEYNAGRTKVLKDWAPATPETPISLEDISYPGTRSYIKQILERREHYRRSLPSLAEN